MIMERFNKKLFLFVILCLSTLLFAGCDFFSFDFFDSSEEDSAVITLAPAEDVTTVTVAPTDNTNEDTEITVTPGASPTPAVQPAATIELSLYTVNMESGATEPFTAVVTKDKEITPELIVDKVVEAMADRSLEVGIEYVKTEKDAIIVSFYRDKAPLSEGGILYEGPILDAIAMSLIGNLKDYNKIIYRAEGEAYVSDHNELGINEPYMTR
jgi:hypothetical protein